MSVDGYETLRPPRKSQFEMVMPREERQEILMGEWKVAQGLIATAIRTNIKAKNQRRRTVNNLGKMTKVEEMMESAQRKLKRVVTLQRRPSSQVSEMTKQHMAAESQRDQLWKEQSREEHPIETNQSRHQNQQQDDQQHQDHQQHNQHRQNQQRQKQSQQQHQSQQHQNQRQNRGR